MPKPSSEVRCDQFRYTSQFHLDPAAVARVDQLQAHYREAGYKGYCPPSQLVRLALDVLAEQPVPVDALRAVKRPRRA